MPIFFFCVLVLLAHGLLIGVFPAQGRELSLSILVAIPAFASIASFWRAYVHGPLLEWGALGLSTFLWAAAMAINLLASTASATGGLYVASLSLFVLYGVPLTFILASSGQGRPYVNVIDGALALTLGILFAVHTQTFATLPESDSQGVLSLQLLFDIENFYIFLFAFFRWRSSQKPKLREFFQRVTQFSLIYFLTAIYINHIESSDANYGGYSDVLIDIPFLLLGAVALSANKTGNGAEPSRYLVHVVAAASPLVLPLSLLVTSALLAERHLNLAIAGFSTAIIGHGLRSVLTQVHSSEAQEHLDELAHTDALTGVANRRRFDEELRRECKRAQQRGENLSLLLIDIDHFKKLNDTMGHQVGDQRLRSVGRELSALSRRTGDVVARYGGEEFAVILPTASGEVATQLAERLRAGIESLRLDAPPPGSYVTVSIGVSCLQPTTGNESAALIAEADACLYEAKRRGRNCVVFRDPLTRDMPATLTQ